MQPRSNQKVCFICGAGHSGSTLLGLILGSHTSCFYAGEAAKTRFLGGDNHLEKKRVCKICGPNCPVWQDFLVRRDVDLYEQIAVRTSRPIVVDSTKNTNWLREQFGILNRTSASLYLILLQRDGRAVINSRIRKYPQAEVRTLIHDWIQQIESTQDLFCSFAGSKIKVHYEDLATNPSTVVQWVCRFLDIPYQPAMLEYYRHEHHPLGGNTGTQSLVARAWGLEGPYVRLSERSAPYYAQHPLDIRLDMRWKRELDPRVEALFEEMAGRLNATFVWE